MSDKKCSDRADMRLKEKLRHFIVRPQTKPSCRKKLERGGPWGAAEPKADGTENKSNS